MIPDAPSCRSKGFEIENIEIKAENCLLITPWKGQKFRTLPVVPMALFKSVKMDRRRDRIQMRRY